MIDVQFANEFANHWVQAWNSHDLDEILTHYADDFEMSSPVIVSTMGESSGRLKGKEVIREYWSKSLAKYPNLRFEKLHVLAGVDSVTIIYDGVRGLSAEMFRFDSQGKVHAAFAHYQLGQSPNSIQTSR